MEGSVSGEVDDPLVRISKLCADGSTVAEAHGAQTAAGDEPLGLLVLHILGCPDLMLTYIGHVNGILIGQITGMGDDIIRMKETGAFAFVVYNLFFVFPAADFFIPRFMLRFLD